MVNYFRTITNSTYIDAGCKVIFMLLYEAKAFVLSFGFSRLESFSVVQTAAQWSAVAQHWLTATSASQVEVILLPQIP